MVNLVIWISSQEARLFFFQPQSVAAETLVYPGPEHDKEVFGRNHRLKETDEIRFFQFVAKHLEKRPTDQWLVLGSGLARVHFQNFLEQSYPLLAKKISHSEKTPKLTNRQIIDKGLRFFQYHSAGVVHSLTAEQPIPTRDEISRL